MPILRAYGLLAILLSGLLLPGGQVNANKLHFCYEDVEIFPYYLGNSLRQVVHRPGVAIQQIYEIQKILPTLSLKIFRAEWQRCLKLLQNNEVDALLSAYNKDIAAMGRFPTIKDNLPDESRAINHVKIYIYSLQQKPVEVGQSDLIGLAHDANIGIQRGHLIEEIFKFSIIDFNSAVPVEKNFLGLTHQRLQAFAAAELSMSHFLIKHPKSALLQKSQHPMAIEPVYLVLSKHFMRKYRQLGSNIWDIMPEIRHYGEALEQIYQQL